MKLASKILAALAVVAWCSSALAYNANDAAKTITTNGTYSDTAAAITYVKTKAQDGWVMTVGSAGGTYTWAARLTVDVPYKFTIQGASFSNRPSITSTLSPVGGLALIVNYATGKVITIKDFIFPETNATDAHFGVYGSGPTAGFRFTNCKWRHNTPNYVGYVGAANGYGGTSIEGPYGLFDNCELDGNGAGFAVFENNNDGTALATWRRPMTWGTQKAVYFEDCNFHGTAYLPGLVLVDFYFGGRIVFRHNTVDNKVLGDHGADRASLYTASSLQREIMHNTFTISQAGAVAPWLMFFRGGTGVAFDNSFSVPASGAELTRPIHWAYFRADYAAGATNGLIDRWFNPLSTTITSASNGLSLPQSTINVADTLGMGGNVSGQYVSIGNLKVTTSAGIQTLVCTAKTTTTFTGCTGGAGIMSTGGAVTRASDYLGTMQPGCGTVGTPGQDPNYLTEPWGRVPIFQWSNTRSGTIVNGNTVDGTNFIGPNRDWYDYGAANKPSNTGKWVDTYTEYTYPHPLQGPQPPTNLRIIP